MGLLEKLRREQAQEAAKREQSAVDELVAGPGEQRGFGAAVERMDREASRRRMDSARAIVEADPDLVFSLSPVKFLMDHIPGLGMSEGRAVVEEGRRKYGNRALIGGTGAFAGLSCEAVIEPIHGTEHAFRITFRVPVGADEEQGSSWWKKTHSFVGRLFTGKPRPTGRLIPANSMAANSKL